MRECQLFEKRDELGVNITRPQQERVLGGCLDVLRMVRSSSSSSDDRPSVEPLEGDGENSPEPLFSNRER